MPRLSATSGRTGADGDPVVLQRSGRRADVQGLRAVAILLVVGFHAGVGPRAGFLGVDVFFAISGFVITRRLRDEVRSTGGIGVADFAARRVRRLLPAMAVMLVVVTAMTVLMLNPFGQQQHALRTAAAASVFAANVSLYRHTGYFDLSAELNPFLHTWSLSVEEQFFLLLPLGWLVLQRCARRSGIARRRLAVWSLVGCSAASLVVALALTNGWWQPPVQAPGRLAFYAMPTRWWEFGAGALAAIVEPRMRGLGARRAAALAAAGLLAVCWSAWALDPLQAHPGGWTVLAVAGTTAVLLGGGRGGPPDRLLSWSPMVRIGDVSYGWYLWHWPAIVLAAVVWPGARAAAVAAAAVSLVPAVVSWRWLEAPVRSSPWWDRRRTARLAAGCVAVPLLVVGVAWRGASSGWGVDEPLGWYDYPPSQGTSCHLLNRDARAPYDPEDCTWGVGRGEPVLVLGDELADGVTPAVVAAAERSGRPVVQWTRAGCPFLVDAVPVGYPACAQYQRDALALIRSLEPAAVVIGDQAPDYTDPASDTVLADAGGGRPDRAVEAARRWATAVRRTTDELRSLGVPVLWVGAAPSFSDRLGRERLSLVADDPGRPAVPRRRVEREGAAGTAALAAMGDPDEVAFIDPVPALCGRDCPAVTDGVWWYLGPRNLTRAGAARLAPGVHRALAPLLSP